MSTAVAAKATFSPTLAAEFEFDFEFEEPEEEDPDPEPPEEVAVSEGVGTVSL